MFKYCVILPRLTGAEEDNENAEAALSLTDLLMGQSCSA